MKPYVYLFLAILTIQITWPMQAVMTYTPEYTWEEILATSLPGIRRERDTTEEIRNLVYENLKKYGVKNPTDFKIKRINQLSSDDKDKLAFTTQYAIYINKILENCTSQEAQLLRDYVIKHEVTHAYEQHVSKSIQLERNSQDIFFLANMINWVGFATFITILPKLPKYFHNNNTALFILFGSLFTTPLIGSIIKLRVLTLNTKLYEMEADLGAAYLGAFNNGMNIINTTGIDHNDGEHPTPREVMHYAQQFLDERKVGNNPSYKELAWKYLWEREIFRPFWQKKIN